MVDELTVSWIQTAVELRGANATVLWINEPAIPHAWRLTPVVKAAIQACDVLINHSFDIVIEEIIESRELCSAKKNFVMVRNFTPTAPLLCTDWAQTPNPEYPYWMHISGDIRTATFHIGDNLVHDRGYLTDLDNPEVLAIAAECTGRTGL